jgi:proline iminopeptidase
MHANEQDPEKALKYYTDSILGSEPTNKTIHEWLLFHGQLLHEAFTETSTLLALEDMPVGVDPKLEAHYQSNKYFIEENYLIQNAAQLKNCKTIIMHGRNDLLTPLSGAYDLHAALNNSSLTVTEGGHMRSDHRHIEIYRHLLTNLLSSC